MAELIPEAGVVFQANRITVGHAVLIARLPQEQQLQSLEAAFRADWQSKQWHAISARELGQWIRDNLMLTLADAVFDREDGQLVPTTGPCVECVKRTGANTALFDDFQQDDRCLDGNCFRAKLDAYIELQKQTINGLVQITRAYYSDKQSGDTVLTRDEYTIIEPTGKHSDDSEQQTCVSTASAIIVEGPGRRGEIVQVCANPKCEVPANRPIGLNRKRLPGSARKSRDAAPWNRKPTGRITGVYSTRSWIICQQRSHAKGAPS